MPVRYNRKQEPIPVVPRTMKIVNADGTVTRSGQLLLEQLQDVGAAAEDIEKATWVIHDTTAGSNVTNLLPVRRTGAAVEAEIVAKDDTTADFAFDILLTRAGDPFSARASVFGASPLLIPAGTPAGEVVRQNEFREEGLAIEAGDVLSADILVGGGPGVYTVVLNWRV